MHRSVRGDAEELVELQEEFVELQLVDYLRIIRRHWRLLGVVTSLVVVASLALVSTQEPVYEATTQVLINTQGRSSVLNDSNARSDPVRIVETERLVIESRTVQDEVRALFPGAADVEARSLGQADVISVRARDADGARAADIANAHVTAYIELRSQQANERLDAARTKTQSQLEATDAAFETQTARLEALEAAGRGAGPEADQLRRERDNLISEQAALRQRLNSLDLEAATVDAQTDVISPASARSTKLVSPSPRMIIAIGLVLGLVLGAGAGILRDHAQRRNATPAAVW